MCSGSEVGIWVVSTIGNFFATNCNLKPCNLSICFWNTNCLFLSTFSYKDILHGNIWGLIPIRTNSVEIPMNAITMVWILSFMCNSGRLNNYDRAITMSYLLSKSQISTHESSWYWIIGWKTTDVYGNSMAKVQMIQSYIHLHQTQVGEGKSSHDIYNYISTSYLSN